MKKRIIITILLFIVTLASGCLLTKLGIDTARETKIKIQEEKNDKQVKKLEKEKKALIVQESELQLSLEIEKNNSNSEKYLEIENKLKEIAEDKKGIEFEIIKVKNGYYNNDSGMNKSVVSSLIYITPGIILFMLSFFILIFGLRKKV